jgi:uncharacterized lipoprotein YddW (UPF0748 family)
MDLLIMRNLTPSPSPAEWGADYQRISPPLSRRGAGATDASGEVSLIQILIIFCLFLLVFSCKKELTVAQNQTTTPTRGVWLTNVASEALYSKENLREAVALCQKSKVNHIFVVMWNKGWTQYPSKIMEKTFGKAIEEKLAGRDPMRELLDEAHAKNIKVTAWMEFGFAAENQGFGKHILEKYPQWAALASDGKPLVKNGFKWMNGFDPEVQSFMTSLMKEIILQYPDLEGVQGDDRLPAMPVESGYNSQLLADYKTETGKIPASDREEIWIDWRVNRLNNYMKTLYFELKKTRPNIIVSMSPSVYPFSKTEYLQDWVTWVQNGWVDMVCPQLYRYDIEKYRAELKKAYDFIPEDKKEIFVPGVLLKVGTYSPTPEYLEMMIQENRKLGVKGEVFFFYEGIKNHQSYFEK